MAVLTSWDGPVDDTNNFGTSTWALQSFKTSKVAKITGISFRGSKGASSSGTTFDVIVRQDTYNGTVLKTETFNTSILPAYTATPSFVDINFATSFNLTDTSKTYFLEIKPNNGHASDELRWSVDIGATYADGSLWTSAGINLTDRDRNFKVLTTITDEPTVAHWKTDETSGNAIDSSGNGNTLINNGGVTYSAGWAINNGTNTRYLAASNSLGYTGADDRTWNLYVNASAINVGYFIDTMDSSTNAKRMLCYVGADSKVHFFVTGNELLSSVISTGVDYMVTIVKSGTNYLCYLNGIYQGTVTPGGASYTGNFFLLLNGGPTGGAGFNGKISRCTILPFALTADEVLQIFNSGRGNAFPFTATPEFYGVLSHYKHDESSGNSLDTINSFHLTNNGTTPYASAKINNGADFNGSSQSMNNNSVLAATSYPRTFYGWFNPDSVTISDRTIFSLSDGSVHYYVLKVRSSDSHIVFRSNNNTQAADVDTGVVAQVGTYYFYTVVQNSSTSVTIRINGVETNTNATTFVAVVSQYYIGYLGRSSVWYLDGKMDEDGIATRAFTMDEHNSLYNSNAGKAYPWLISSPVLQPAFFLNFV